MTPVPILVRPNCKTKPCAGVRNAGLQSVQVAVERLRVFAQGRVDPARSGTTYGPFGLVVFPFA